MAQPARGGPRRRRRPSGDEQRGQRPVADDVVRLRQGHRSRLAGRPARRDGGGGRVRRRLAEQFDQAGVLVRADERHWVKAGVEVSDGAPQLGAVATRGVSDWSVAPVPDWAGCVVTVRASREGDALTVRARAAGPWQLVRVAPLDPSLTWLAGPYACAPTRGRPRGALHALRARPGGRGALHPG